MTTEPPQDAPDTPVKIQLLTAEEFLQQAQSPEAAAMIDTAIETIQVTTGATDRQMLRTYALLLRSIAVSMPWNEEDGMDARRFHRPSKTSMPSWRECIGSCLHLEFSKPEDESASTDSKDSEDDGSQEQ